MKILAFGFGTTPIFIKALIEHLQQTAGNVSWSVILPSSHHQKIMIDLLGEDAVFCLKTCLLSQEIKKPDMSVLKDYPGNIYKDIETEKISLKHKKSKKQLQIAVNTYVLLRDYVKAQQPDFILYVQPPEGMNGLILANISTEFGIPLVVPHHTRSIGLSFFSGSPQEVLPDYGAPDTKDYECAEKFLKRFRDMHIDPVGYQKESVDDDFIAYSSPSRFQRAINYLKRLRSESGSNEIGALQVSLLNVFPFYRDFYRGLRGKKNSQLYNCESLINLPDKFIFYPLQYSPESSINVPAPYFVDQLRVVDAIRMAMPSDTMLVVKEHPVCMNVRPSALMKALLRKAGVVVIKYDIDTQEIIKKASLTISVTGTAAFEAFLNGKPSIVMGPVFFSKFLGGECSIDQLKARISEKINFVVPDDQILDALTQVYSVSSEFYGRAPGEVGGKMMTRKNVINFWSAFLNHMDKQVNDIGV